MRRLVLAAVSALAMTTSLIGAAPAQADDGRSAPGRTAPGRIASGWMPYWMTSTSRPAGINTAVANADVLSEVSPFWYSAVAGGPNGVTVKFNTSFTNAAANQAWAMQQLRGAGLSVMPAIADGSGKGRMAATLADPAKRAGHVADIVGLVTSNGYDGIDLDYEVFAFTDGRASWPATQPNWVAFVNELGNALHAQGKQLSVTVPGPCDTLNRCSGQYGYWVYSIPQIAGAADIIRIMAYDFHVQGIGAIAPLPWVNAIVAYTVGVMPASKLQIGVPTYGRSWTKKDAAGKYRLSGSCPTSGSVYTSLTGMVSTTEADIPGVLVANGADPAAAVWNPTEAEYSIEYDKNVTWSGGTCTARRIMWWGGTQGVMARTNLVAQYGLRGAAYWTIGGENAEQWPAIRALGQQLAPAETAIAVTASPTAVFNTQGTITAVVTSNGAPVTDAPATLEFRPDGKKTKWRGYAQLGINPDGTVTFTPTLTEPGRWRVTVPAGPGRAAGVTEPVNIATTSAVRAGLPKAKVKRGTTAAVRVVALPGTAGQQVLVQEQRGDKWRTIARGKTNAKGVVRVRIAAGKVTGPRILRAVAKPVSWLGQGVSEPVRLRVTR